MLRRMFRLVVLLPFLLSISLSFAQVITGTISGTVKDSTGAVVPGASVTVMNLGTGISRSLTTDAEGRYRATNLSLGAYEVQASSAGFQTAVRRGMELTVGREAVVNFTMEVGAVAQTVEVTGEAPLVDTTSSAVKGLVAEKTILDLPLNGRSFTQLAALEAGVQEAPYAGGGLRGGGGEKISVSGTRPEHTSFLLDGFDIKDSSQKSPGSVAGVLLGVETVREFSTIKNSFSAEFGTAAGGVINAVTKAGTNQFHGSVFEFLRNSALDARRFNDPEEPPPFKRNQFGGVVGGPILRNQFFFFTGYEGLRDRLATTSTSVVPDLNARQGFLPAAPGSATLENVAVDPAVKPYLDLFPPPSPHGRNFADGTQQFFSANTTATDEDFFQIRADYALSSSDSFFVRYTYDNATIQAPDDLGVTTGTRTASRNQFVALEQTKVLSPVWLNVFRLGFSRTMPSTLSTADRPAALSFIPGRPLGNISVIGLASLGTPAQPEQLFGLQRWELSDKVSYGSGAHNLSAGFLGQWYQFHGYTRTRVNGLFQFQTLRDFLTRRPNLLEAAIPGSTFERSMQQFLFGFFVQDDYRFRPNLSLNLGLRYEFYTVPTERHGRMVNLRDILDPTTTVGDPHFLNPSLKNVSPRVGFAWDVFSDGRTSVRGGFGVFYEYLGTYFWRDQPLQNGPLFRGGRITNPPPQSFPYPDFSALGDIPLEGYGIDYDLSQPYVLQYNLMVEKELMTGRVFHIGYVGNRGIHQGRSLNNTAFGQILPDGRKFFPAGSPRRNPNFGNTFYRTFDTNSHYDSLQVGFKKKLSRGLLYQASYTFSKFIDELSGTVGGSDFNNSSVYAQDQDNRSEKGLSSYDVRHKLTLNYAYELPFGRGGAGFAGKLIPGWQWNGILNLYTGIPINIRNNTNRSRDNSVGRINERPNLVAGASNNPTSGTSRGCTGVPAGTPLGASTYWFDPCAFALQEAGFYGNLGRNTLIGPGKATFDFSLFKNTALGENRNLQFRAEFFNLFNRVNFGRPSPIVFTTNTGAPSGTAGNITSTNGTARQIQFALKLTF